MYVISPELAAQLQKQQSDYDKEIRKKIIEYQKKQEEINYREGLLAKQAFFKKGIDSIELVEIKKRNQKNEH